MQPSILFEDDSMIVINKPFGVVVNRADTTAKLETIQDFAEKHIDILKIEGGTFDQDVLKSRIQDQDDQGNLSSKNHIRLEFFSRGGIVHRLDKDTSGVLVIAKNPEAFENLKNQFKDRKTVKKYLALVHGKMEPAMGKIDAPIERSPFNRMRFGVFPGGREAVTMYKSLKNFKLLKGLKQGQDDLTLLEVTPQTGRTHQIRVHMKHLGHPIVSDPIYGGRKQIREDLKWCPRLFLHAASLEIAHPVSGQKMVFEAKLPTELENVLNSVSTS